MNAKEKALRNLRFLDNVIITKEGETYRLLFNEQFDEYVLTLIGSMDNQDHGKEWHGTGYFIESTKDRLTLYRGLEIEYVVATVDRIYCLLSEWEIYKKGPQRHDREIANKALRAARLINN